METVKVGQVVRFTGGRRRYVVASVNRWDRLALCAMSGAMPGCQPTNIDRGAVNLDTNQKRGARGKQAAYLRRRFVECRAMCRSWGDPVDPSEAL